MDGDGSSFTFPSTSDYPKGQDATDISWADIFLDGIHSDDPGTTEAGGISTDTSSLAASIHGSTQQFIHQQQPSVMGGQLQIHIPTHLQGSLTSNAVQQANANLCGTVAYLTPASTHQQVGTAGRIQNVVNVAGGHQMAASVGQQQHQGNAKLVQIASSFPMASVQQLTNSVPIQTLLQPNQTLTGQTIYGGQGTGLFPTQGSVHIENPKVVNVNFGPHVIGSDGSGQQAIIQTAEGKRVLITNSQLQHMPQYLIPQSISLTQPLVGTQLINSAGGSVIRASMAPGTHTLMPASSTGTQQIMLPSGQTVIPRQANNQQGGIAKNVVLRPLNQNMSPVIYQSGQGGSLIHSQPTLITSSGAGLQVVNTGGSQGGQVQLISQPSLNQTGIGQQQLNQGTIMNLINNQGVIPGAGNQITGLVPGQNIFVNGQMINISQLGGLMPQLQVQHNPQGGVTLTNINAQFQPTTQQLVIQHNGQQQQMLLQPKSTQSPSVISNNVTPQRLSSGLLGSKNAATPTSNANSASSTPVLTPTPSTPTPTPTPDLMSDSCDSGGKSSQGINILEQALAMSAIDLQSFEDDFNFLDNSDCFSSVTTPPMPVTPVPSLPKQKPQPAKTKSKTSKSKSKMVQPTVNVTVNSNVQFQQPIQLQNAQGQKITISPQQKIITANGQVYVLSSNGQQFILQPSASPLTSQLKAVAAVVSSAGSVNKTNISIPTSSQLHIKEANQDQSSFSTGMGGQLKLNLHNASVSLQPKILPALPNAQSDNKFFIKANPDGSTGTFKIETSIQSVPTAQIMFTTMSTVNNSPSTISYAQPSQTFAANNETQFYQEKNQTITTLGGMFLKQEPLEALVKQEPESELQQSVSHAQDLLTASVPSTMNITHTSLAATTSSVIALSTPLVVSSALFSALTTSTTQSHQVTIMSSSPMAGSQQMYVTAARTSLPSQASLVVQPQITSTVSSTTPISSATLKSNSKEKDPATIKSMIPVKIADSTLMLSLTPGEKERLESQLSRMNKKDQEGLLMYQQNIIRRTQQVQQKQLEQHLKQKKLLQLQPQEFQQVQREPSQQPQQPQQIQQLSQQQVQQLTQQQVQQLTQQQIQQFSQQQIQQPQLQQQQSQQLHNQTLSLALKMSQPSQVNTRSELLSPQAGTGLPTTVQELMDKSEEQDSQQSFQPFPTTQPQDQPQQMHQTPPLQQSHPNLQQNHGVQQYLIPQIGRCLAEQQLLRDRSLALSPDVGSSFKSLSDAMRRLVRYHTLQDHKPEEESKTMKTWDTRYHKLCDYLVKKKRCYLRRFSKMQLYKDMCPHKRPEHIQNLMCFNEQLRELIEHEKEKAANNPDLFEPIHQEFLSLGHSCSEKTVKSSIVGTESATKVIKESIVESEIHALKKEYFGVKETFLDPDNRSEKSVSPYASPNSQKRKLPDKGSTGTLKLVLKRRTTDNFIVKKPSADINELYKKSSADVSEFFHKSSAGVSELTPKTTAIASVDRSDSECDFDSQTTDVACNPPVVVRPRTLSVASRQTSSDSGSDNSSFNSQTDKIQDHSSVEEDLEEEEDDDDEEEMEKSSGDDDDDGEQFLEGKTCSKRKYHALFGDEAEENVNDDSCMETDALSHYKMGTPDVSGSSLLRYADKPWVENLRSRKKTSHLLSNNVSATPDVFNSSLSSPLSNSLPAKELNYDNLYSNQKRLDNSTFSFEANAIGIPSSFSQRCNTLSSTQDEYISESSVSNIEKEGTRKDIAGSSLFTTPNKSLLETDDMFNSDDEDDDIRGGRRIVSTFEIDNKDPQSSMINDSVRSAINSVLDGGDDDDDSDDSQTSWASAARRPSSSSSTVHRNLFHAAASSSFPHGHDADLDAAVQSILNS